MGGKGGGGGGALVWTNSHNSLVLGYRFKLLALNCQTHKGLVVLMTKV